MITITINNQPCTVYKNNTIMQVCRMLNINVPHFCYHNKLSIAGNCRICLVEVGKSVKPAVSCALPVLDNMQVFTNTALIKEVRETILEFLLSNHPLDCPICDQGGECDLQDETMFYGNDSNKFFEYKRAVEDKDCGPLVKMVMTRCIHCTRCVRFATEIAGMNELGVLGRGQNMEIGEYIAQLMKSEISGNIIDICPVGALTAKPTAYKIRSWELKSTETIDLLDALSSNIQVDTYKHRIVRVLPLVNEFINDNWISDKTRFALDGLNIQRLQNPQRRIYFNDDMRTAVILKYPRTLKQSLATVFYKNGTAVSPLLRKQLAKSTVNSRNIHLWRRWIRKTAKGFQQLGEEGIYGKPRATSWNQLLTYLNFALTPGYTVINKKFVQKFPEMKIILSNYLNLESLYLLKQLSQKCNINDINFSKKYIEHSYDFRCNYILNLDQIEKADLCILINVNPRYEGSMLNLKLRQTSLKNGLIVASIGPCDNLTYDTIYLGNHLKVLIQLLEGRHPFSLILKSSKKPLFILGSSCLNKKNSLNIINAFYYSSKYIKTLINDSWFALQILHDNASRMNSLELGLIPNYPKNITTAIPDILYSLGEPLVDTLYYYNDYYPGDYSRPKENCMLQAYIIFQGHTAFEDMRRYADLIMPTLPFTETSGYYINNNYILQETNDVIDKHNLLLSAYPDWKILLTLLEHVTKKRNKKTNTSAKNLILNCLNLRKESLDYNGSVTNKTIFDIRQDLLDRYCLKIKHFNNKNIISQKLFEMSHIYNNMLKECYKNENVAVKSNLIKFYYSSYKTLINNFYMNDTISNNSKVMADCTAILYNDIYSNELK